MIPITNIPVKLVMIDQSFVLFIDDYIVAQIRLVPNPQIYLLFFFHGYRFIIEEATDLSSAHQSVGRSVKVQVDEILLAAPHFAGLFAKRHKKIFVKSPVHIGPVPGNRGHCQQSDTVERHFRVLHGGCQAFLTILVEEYTDIFSFPEITLS